MKIPMETVIDEDGFFKVSSPLFNGCHTFGATEDEALEYFKEIVSLVLEESLGEFIN
jgi:predicted RNase H-like HicB family nuclease